jgi:hypothetical protein
MHVSKNCGYNVKNVNLSGVDACIMINCFI